MPRKPKRPCSYPGCPRLVDGRYCEEHAKLVGRQYEKYGWNYDSKKRYGRVCKRIRDWYASQHPLCERCLKDGTATSMDEVHHIRPLAEGGTHDDSNLMALCKSFHSKIHAEWGNRWHNKGQG